MEVPAVIPAFEGQRQKDQEFKTSLHYRDPGSIKKERNNKNQIDTLKEILF